MPRAPTSIRLRPEQEAELAALARDLAAARPDLAAAAHRGELTPGAVLRLAVARGLAVLRRDLSAPIADAPLVLDPFPPPLPPRMPPPPLHLDPWEPEPPRAPAGSPLPPPGAPADDHARAWPASVAAPEPAPAPEPPAPGMLPGQALLPPYREPLR